jgi:hypothetical protein
MIKLLTTVAATLAMAVLVAATSPVGSALIAGIALNGID